MENNLGMIQELLNQHLLKLEFLQNQAAHLTFEGALKQV